MAERLEKFDRLKQAVRQMELSDYPTVFELQLPPVRYLDGKDFQGGRVRVELVRPPGRRGSRPGAGPKTDYRIDVANYTPAARKMMRRMGWKAGEGLGRQCNGILEPIKAFFNQVGRRGLGWHPNQRSTERKMNLYEYKNEH